MARPKGQPKLGGRKKGTPNKITEDARKFIEQAARNFQQNPATAIETIDPKIFWGQIYSKLIPKDINVKAQLWTRQLSDAELDERIRQIQAELNESTTETDAESEPE